MQILVEGQSIRHEQYGMGIVTESNTERTTIDFDDHGVKKFVTSIWSAELVGEPPATPPTKRRGRRKSVKKVLIHFGKQELRLGAVRPGAFLFFTVARRKTGRECVAARRNAGDERASGRCKIQA